MTEATVKDRVEYAGVVAFLGVVRLLPKWALPDLCRLLGTLAFDVARYRRAVALANLARHLPVDGEPDKPGSAGDARQRIGRESVQNFTMGLAEFARLRRVDEAYIRENIEVAGLANLDRVLTAGRGAILVTGHFGSWELSACVLAGMGYPVDLLVGVQRNRLVQDLMNGLRSSCGVGIIEPRHLVRAFRSLRANRFVAMLSDQDAGRNGVFVDFLGEQASTPKGPARLSMLAGAPIVPGFIVRTAGCEHRVVIEEPIWPPRTAGETTLRDLTQAYTAVIEGYVRRYPGQWLWTHRRWKSRPA